MVIHRVFFLYTFSLSLLCNNNVASAYGRGTDFGNGGDPIREVFNAGRVFGQQLLAEFKQNTPHDSDINYQPTKIYLNYINKIIDHLKNAEHQWGKYPLQQQCARSSLADSMVLKLSYENCRDQVSNYKDATIELITASLKSIVEINEIDSIEVSMKNLAQTWKAKFPKSYAQATYTSTNTYIPITGIWTCGSADISEFVMQWYPGGIVRGQFLLPAHSNKQIFFEKITTIDPSHQTISITGVYKIPRPASADSSNIIRINSCDYKTSLLADASKNKNILLLNMNIASHSSDQTCPKIFPKKLSLTCERTD